MEKKPPSPIDRAFEFEAYIPVYDNGNVVDAITTDGKDVRINKSIKSLINSLMRKNSIDMRLLRKNLSEYTERKIFIPIPISSGIVLVPVKVRRTVITNDGAYAYINLNSAKKLSGERNCIIALNCGRKITSLESEKTIRARMKSAAVIMDGFSSMLLCGGDLNERMSGPDNIMGKPLTKGDVYLIAYQIIKLLNGIRMN